MTGIVYILVAAVAATLSTRAWLTDRTDPTKIAFLSLGWAMALTWVLFALSLLPGLGILRIGYMAAGACLPAISLYCIDRVFGDREAPPSPMVLRILVATAGMVPITVGLHGAFYLGTHGLSPPVLTLGVYSFTVCALLLYRLYQVHESTRLRVDKVRLRYMIGVTSGAVVFALAEQLGRILSTPDPTAGLGFAARAVALQGPLPPISLVMAGLALYFLYHSVVSYRLLDLYELFSRMAALLASAIVLVIVDGIAVLWVDTFEDYPLHTAFQTLVASVLFLAAYDPMKKQIDWWFNRWLNRRGHQLGEALEGLRSEVPLASTKDSLTRTLLRRLHGSGRVPVCSVYLWNQARDAYTLAGIRGEVQGEPLAAVAGPPFTDGFTEQGMQWYNRGDLMRRARAEDPVAIEIIGMMDAMHSDLTVPFRSGEAVLGWMHLQDEDWSDGFSAEEMLKLASLGELATVVLSNIRAFRELEEAHRLAALGAMAAGLAHEIRNPLAGIKGAAQFLQGEQLEGVAMDMLNVVVTEADRLNVVVSQFLEYARPFKLHCSNDHINAVVTHVLALLRAQGVPPSIQIKEELAGDLPVAPLDRVKISQVLLNLLQNALQAMPNGGTLLVRTKRKIGRNQLRYLEVSVSDTGGGISQEALEQLFVPFFTTKEKGTGLGLAISQRIAQAHGGEIEVHSRPGRGATFQMVLPLPKKPGDESKQPEADRNRLNAAPGRQGSITSNV
ncbi:MAG: two-component system sensor histidine kinase HydH [Kiritimatiellia bacterium]|jgi:two-component system sensor histidine kinase HydH